MTTDFDGESDDRKTALDLCNLPHIDSTDVQQTTKCDDEYYVIPSIT